MPEGTPVHPRSLALAALLAVFTLAGLAGPAGAAPGDPDLAFGTAGITTLSGIVITDEVLQDDGKIVVVGARINGNSIVARLSANGALDPAFGTGGIVDVDFSDSGGESLYSVAVLPNGKIVGVGYRDDGQYDTTVVQLNSNGSPDGSFGAGGKLELSMGNTGSDDDEAAAVVAGPDNKIIFAGYRDALGDSDIYVAQLTQTGSFDTSFNSAGSSPGRLYYNFIAPLAVSASNDYAWDMVRLADGSLRVLGDFDAPNPNNVGQAVLAITAGGTIDTSYGAGGTGYFANTVSDLNEGSADQLAVLSDGRVVYSSQGNPYGARSVVARRVLASGTAFDPTFGTSGRAEFSYAAPHDFYLTGMAQAADGGLFFSGRDSQQTGSPGFLLRSTGDGQPVGLYGEGGFAFYRGGGYLSGIAPQADGHVIATTLRGTPGGVDSDVVRLTGDYVAPPAPPIAATVKIKSPSKKKIKASKFKSVSGSAAGTGVTKVQLAIQRIDSKLLKKNKRCLYVTSSKGKTKKYKATKKKKCEPSKYLKAKGTSSWSYKLRLKPGKYKLTVRAIGAAGTGKSSTKTFTITK